MVRPGAPLAIAKQERKFEFFQAILECQVGQPRIDFEKLAHRLGYKNERCAADSYYRFCREHLKRIHPAAPAVRSGSGVDGVPPRPRRPSNWKQTYDVNGVPTDGFQDDEEEEEEAEGAGGGRVKPEVKQEFPVWNLESFLRSTEEIARETSVVVVKDEDEDPKEVDGVVVKKETVPEVWKW
ncbi:hypothetical protein P167DRAFT_410977 [Morchella conica CCBAS932]|uniref:Uncharacterized protein n=1 Tax=Morchella conica CCBAS932 TaxID=1392247 RepID=A0A3N4L2G3_9PEZI|nr:hypothetical protein P167DRAFT_410977 [Morchella conica CCBAS932]